MNRQAWIDHTFQTGIDPGWQYNLISRLEDVVVRIRHLCASLSDEELARSPGGRWSIKQHLGHLIDLEELHTARLRQFNQRVEILGAADMQNRRTNEADHNSTALDDLLARLQQGRKHFIETFQLLTKEDQNHRAIHPRLKVTMRPVDLLNFVAEHDDHHICSMKEIINAKT